MFDPPTDSPPTPEDLVACGDQPRSRGTMANPVPSVMQAAVCRRCDPYTIQRDLMHGMTSAHLGRPPKQLIFFTFTDDPDNPAGSDRGTFPAATIRVPRGRSSTARPPARGRRRTPSTGTASSRPP